jgi:hypothetical protein
MTLTRKPPLNPHGRAPSADELDGLLAQFFRATVPEPWPSCPRPQPEAATVPQPQQLACCWMMRAPGRLALVAAVAGVVIGYLSLQSSFPDPTRAVVSPVLDLPQIGYLQPGLFLDRTESGRPVNGEIQPLSDPKKFLIRIEEVPVSK